MFENVFCSNAAACGFDKSLTAGSAGFILVIFIGLAICGYILKKLKVKHIIVKFFIMVCGVSLFEVFTAPMWNNAHLGTFGYYYRDISWILTLGWTTLLLANVSIIDHFFKKLSEPKKFSIYILVNIIAMVILENIVIQLGIRSYAPELTSTLSGIKLIQVPVEAVYYIPVFSSLVISFYKYMLYVWKAKFNIPVNRKWDIKGLALTVIAVFALELLIHPLVNNLHLPQWGYLVYDLHILILAGWVLCIYIPMILINKLLIHWKAINRFMLQIVLSSLLFYQFEAAMIAQGVRQYGKSTTANFIGIETPISGLPVEIAFAVIMYMILILSFVKYWKLALEGNYEK